MMTHTNLKFQGKYRLPSARLEGWDYGSPGYYFVTICTRDHIPWFGEIIDGRVAYSRAGQIAVQELEFTPIIRPYINLETWIVMPNHIHALIEIVETPRRGVSTHNVSTTWKSGTLGAIINQYKSVCTKRIRALDYIDFAWQPRFYEHIIWNIKELENIHAYILENPTQWAEDEYFSNFSKL